MPSYRKNLESPSEDALHDVLIISARKGYSLDAHEDLGYHVIQPYRDNSIAGRIARETWFRLPLKESKWYTPIGNAPKCIIVHDPLITTGYLEWLQKQFPEARINFLYWNLVGKAKHLAPEELPDGIDAWTYDDDDARNHGMKLLDTLGFPTIYMGEDRPKKHDVVFVGADKGRAKYLLELQESMNDLGLKTDFRIMPDGRFSKRESFHSKRIPYKDVIDLVCESRAVLNLCDPRQTGATLRDYESVFNEVKLVTNNANVKSFVFYNPENVFILGERPLNELPNFLNTPFSPLDETILRKCTLNAHIDQIYKDGENE